MAIKPRSPKSTNAEIAIRVEQILRIRLDGAQFHEIREYAEAQKWGVSDSMLRKYITKADELLVERRDTRVRRRKALHLARRESMYARSVQAADYRTALACLQDMAKFEQLYEDNKGLAKQVAELLARLAGAEGGTDEPAKDSRPGEEAGGGVGSEAEGEGG